MLIWINSFHAVIVFALFTATIYVIRRPPSRIQNYLLTLSICTLVTVVGYTIQINADCFDNAISGLMICYVGLPFAMYSLSFFIFERYGYSNMIKKWLRNLFISLCPTVSILVFTCEFQPFYFSHLVFIDSDFALSHLEFGHGVLYYVYLSIIAVLLLCDTILVISEIKTAKNSFEKSQAYCILGLIFSPILGFIIYRSGITRGYDTTIVGTFIGCCFLFALFFKYKLFDFIEDAKEHALDASDGGILVLNANGKVAYASRLLKKTFPGIVDGEGSKCLSILHDYAAEKKVFSFRSRFYNVKEFPIIEGGYPLGSAVELHDITDSYLHARRLEEEVSYRTTEIMKIQRKITVGFANLVEARDKGTGDHVRRTGAMVALIAKTMKKDGNYRDILTSNYISMLEETAPLHDLGKISIPDEILLKPGKLTDDEFETMKGHTTMGKALIEKVLRGIENDDYVSMAEDISLYHHERWNGKGYPCGLSGSDIPLCARIMSIADVYDALRSDRCYKSAMSHQDACRIIVEERGKQFDPAVVDAFMKNSETIEKMMGSEIA